MRGTGRTTDQLEKCKHNSIFLVHTVAMVSHAKEILNQLNRKDIRVDYLSNLEGGNVHRYSGIRFSDVVLDHACFEAYIITDNQWKCIHYLRSLVRSI